MKTTFPFFSQRTPRRAFTLIEILIAMAIFSAVLIAIYSTWMSIVRGTKIGMEAAGDAQRARIAMHTVEHALLTAQLYAENSRYYNFITDKKGDFSSVQFTSRLPGTFLGGGYFGDQTVRQIAFYVERGDGDQNNLVMTQVPLLDANEQEDPYKIVLVRDVTHFELEYWTPNDKDFTSDFSYTNQLPKLVRITLGIGHMRNNPSLPNEVDMRLINIPSDIALSRF